MRKEQTNYLCIPAIGLRLFLIVFLLFTLSSCRKETINTKLSSKNCYVLPYPTEMMSYYLCDGELGFYTFRNTNPDTSKYVLTIESDLSRLGLNTSIGTFSQSPIAYNPLIPKFATRSNSFIQIKPNTNGFFMLSQFEQYDSTLTNSYTYFKVYLTYKNITSVKDFELIDSSASVNNVVQMPDGRYVVTSTKGTAKSISCYNNDLQFVWTRSANFGINTQDYENREILVSSNSMYLLQVAKYFTQNYRIIQYDFNGKMISNYDLNSTTNKYAAGQLIESPNGFYIIGTKYIPEKSDYDINISSMSPSNNLLSEHGLNITKYLPDWNTAIRNVNKIYFSGSTSFVIKTAKGYAFAFAYPDSKNKYSLALVMLNKEMKLEGVKKIAKNIDGFSQISNEYLTLLNDENHLYIMWKQLPTVYFYTLDQNGDFLNQ